MRILALCGLVCAFVLFSSFTSDSLPSDVAALRRESLDHGEAYENLRALTSIGPRLSGSENAARAVAWAKARLESYGFDRVWLEPVQVPRWTRGAHERAWALMSGGRHLDLRVTALGGSVGTDAAGLTAEVVEVHSLDEVAELGEAVRGKIVFYNRPMDPTLNDTFEAYARAADQRFDGPSQAARFGAVAVLVRSLSTLPDDDHPHTGMLSYRSGVARIPAAALSTHAANELSALLKRDPRARVRLGLSAERHGLVPSYNVIAELRGSERPDEIVLVGGHLDSWDLAPGAHDDGAGVVQAIESLRAIKAAGLHPRRTVRVVLFMAEEFGSYGGRAYAKAAREAAAHGVRHVLALESDCGGFAPEGFSGQADDATWSVVRDWAGALAPLGADDLREGESGADIEDLRGLGTAVFGYRPVSRHYFDLHHSELDRFEAVKKPELDAGAAAMAEFIYLASETL